jgi:hypothetical protein
VSPRIARVYVVSGSDSSAVFRTLQMSRATDKGGKLSGGGDDNAALKMACAMKLGARANSLSPFRDVHYRRQFGNAGKSHDHAVRNVMTVAPRYDKSRSAT